MNTPGLRVKAPAKINLYLEVTGRRDDGYHLLRTLMVKLDLSDSLEIYPRTDGIVLETVGRPLSNGEDNLVHRAARAFFEETGLRGGVEILLEKRIPVAAGLGGGSSDAAAALRGLNELFGRPVPEDRLASLGLSLGADVPFFIYPSPAAWATGIGEELSAGPIFDKIWLLLVNPGWPLSTAEVFKNFRLELTRKGQNHIFCGLNESSFTIDRHLYNDLERVVLPRHPEVRRIKERLLSAGAAGALMTGSGPTVFGIFPSLRDLEGACRHLELDDRRWDLLPTFTPPAA